MTAVVYADFSCPACYLASLRVDRLLDAGHPVPDWRGVEHKPHLPVTGIRLEPSARADRGRELAEVRALLGPGEELPAAAPGILPNTRAAVAAYAEAYGAGVAQLVRPLLFHSYWVDGMDIGDPEVLRRLLPDAFRQGRRTSDPIRDFGYAVTSQRGPITTDAHRRIRTWHQDWLALGTGVALALVTDSTTLVGGLALAHLTESARSYRPVAPEPRPRSGSPVLVPQP